MHQRCLVEGLGQCMQAAVAFGQIGVATDQQNGKARSLGAYGLGPVMPGIM